MLHVNHHITHVVMRITFCTPQDQALQRSFIVEKATAVAASPCGTYVAAGGVSGSIYIWEVASGRLLR